MPDITPAVLTGKSFTFTYDGVSGTAQVTKSSVEKSTEGGSTLQTFGGQVDVPGVTVSKVSCELLYDGHNTGSIYAALDAALEAQTAGTLAIAGPSGDGWTGTAKVAKLSAETPADGAMTAKADLTISGPFPFTAATAGARVTTATK